MTFAFLFLIIIAIPVTWAICQNGLVAAKARVDEGWAGITVQLKRRHALVPNLVQAVQTAMSHENSIFDRLLEARAQAVAALAGGDQADVTKAEADLTAALNGFVGYAEDTPEITANENTRLLQKQLEETEDQIAAARRLFNGNVTAYNTKIQQIPWSVVAGRGDFPKASLYEVDGAELARISKDVSLAEMGFGAGEKS